MRLEGQVAIITGGGSGIGRATALRFAQEGCRIAVIDRDRAEAEETVGAILAKGGDAAFFASDVSLRGQADEDRAAVLDRFGRIDILMTAAGFSCGGTVVSVDPDDWNAVIETNLNGTFFWCRAVIPTMQRQKRGSIITIASQLALAGGAGSSAYIAAKGAILSLTRSMALDFAQDGIRVNALVPGAIDTPMLARGFERRIDPDAAKRASLERHPMKRFGRAEEAAEAALFLGSDASSFTTGTSLVVDGGWLAG